MTWPRRLLPGHVVRAAADSNPGSEGIRRSLHVMFNQKGVICRQLYVISIIERDMWNPPSGAHASLLRLDGMSASTSATSTATHTFTTNGAGPSRGPSHVREPLCRNELLLDDDDLRPVFAHILARRRLPSDTQRALTRLLEPALP